MGTVASSSTPNDTCAQNADQGGADFVALIGEVGKIQAH
jgi:hypothetical protein